MKHILTLSKTLNDLKINVEEQFCNLSLEDKNLVILRGVIYEFIQHKDPVLTYLSSNLPEVYSQQIKINEKISLPNLRDGDVIDLAIVAHLAFDAYVKLHKLKYENYELISTDDLNSFLFQSNNSFCVALRQMIKYNVGKFTYRKNLDSDFQVIEFQGVDLPKPLRKVDMENRTEVVWVIIEGKVKSINYVDSHLHNLWLEIGRIYDTEEDAEIWLEFLKEY